MSAQSHVLVCSIDLRSADMTQYMAINITPHIVWVWTYLLSVGIPLSI